MAWENDLVGFRAYGPALQARGESGFGYDLFTKRGTAAPVLEDIYAKELDACLLYTSIKCSAIMKTNYEIRYAEHPDDVKSYDTVSYTHLIL